MDITIPITQLRAQLGTVLKRLREDPRIVFRITHHGEIVADLKAPGADSGDGNSTRSPRREVADFVEAYLQGTQPRNKGTYAQLRELGSAPLGSLPYDSVEEAMQAIRSRADGAG